MPDKHHTRNQILALVRANPQISMRELLVETGIRCSTNVQYHLRRLDAEGLIHYEPKGTKMQARFQQAGVRWQRGDVPMPKMSKMEEQRRIEMVVAKAISDQRSAFSEDADLRVLANGVKVVIRKPALWGSKAHQAG